MKIREKKIQKKKKKITMFVNASKCALGSVFFFFFLLENLFVYLLKNLFMYNWREREREREREILKTYIYT